METPLVLPEPLVDTLGTGVEVVEGEEDPPVGEGVKAVEREGEVEDEWDREGDPEAEGDAVV